MYIFIYHTVDTSALVTCGPIPKSKNGPTTPRQCCGFSIGTECPAPSIISQGQRATSASLCTSSAGARRSKLAPINNPSTPFSRALRTRDVVCCGCAGSSKCVFCTSAWIASQRFCRIAEATQPSRRDSCWHRNDSEWPSTMDCHTNASRLPAPKVASHAFKMVRPRGPRSAGTPVRTTRRTKSGQ